MYAVGQGALAVECRVNDDFILRVLSKLCDFKTQCRILTERSFLKSLGGGCSAPVGINSVISESSDSIKQQFTLKVNGGVWSLDGKDEVTDQDSIEFALSVKIAKVETEDDELDVSPSKRAKLDENEIEKLKKSPEIIDESSCSLKGEKNASEIVNIHGKVFDACPFSGQSRSTATNETKSISGCPVKGKFDVLKLPIGQDFMGECPVLNTAQKINYDSSDPKGGGDSLGCPVGKSFATSSITSEEIEKCPFLSKQKEEIVQLIDYEENAQKNPKHAPKSLVDNLTDVQLYCGFFCHDKSLKSIFDQCEELGISLANKLISAGALEIMKVAQDEIHSKC